MTDPIIKLKRSSVAGKIPSTLHVPLGELALNTHDGYLYASKDVGAGVTVIAINPFRVGTGTDTYNIHFTQGNVGIGTTNPTAKLDVNGDIRLRGAIYDENNVVGSANSILTSTGSGVIWSAPSGSSTINATDTTDSATYYPVFVAETGSDQTPRARSTTTAFSFVPSTGTLTAVDFNSASDANLKTNIKQISDPIPKILQLNGVTFNWIDTNKPSVGIIAQDVERVLPELVTQNNSKSVNYNGIIGLLVESIKEQQKQIYMMQEEIQELKSKNKSI